MLLKSSASIQHRAVAELGFDIVPLLQAHGTPTRFYQQISHRGLTRGSYVNQRLAKYSPTTIISRKSLPVSGARLTFRRRAQSRLL